MLVWQEVLENLDGQFASALAVVTTVICLIAAVIIVVGDCSDSLHLAFSSSPGARVVNSSRSRSWSRWILLFCPHSRALW